MKGIVVERSVGGLVATAALKGTNKGMVYLLADWGMGESETRSRKYAEPSRDLLRIEPNQFDGYNEVDLHPLSNQV